jgi:hypothetical protein
LLAQRCPMRLNARGHTGVTKSPVLGRSSVTRHAHNASTQMLMPPRNRDPYHLEAEFPDVKSLCMSLSPHPPLGNCPSN